MLILVLLKLDYILYIPQNPMFKCFIASWLRINLFDGYPRFYRDNLVSLKTIIYKKSDNLGH